MEHTVQIRCRNNMQTKSVIAGSTLSEVYRGMGLDMAYGPVSAKVNNKVEGLHYRLYHNKDVEFLDLRSSSGHRAYTRTLFFVLCKAVHDLYPSGSVVIDIPVSNGYYCDLQIGHEVTEQDVDSLRRRMQQIIDAAYPVRRHEAPTEEAVRMFRELGTHSKVTLLETVGNLYTTYYEIDGYVDYFYGTMLTNTSKLYLFDLVKYYDGALLRIPSMEDPSRLGELIRQDKMFEIFCEHHRWQNILGIGTAGAFNDAVKKGLANSIINVSEALQEKKIAHIADLIAERKDVKMVLIAGPSSSGKTTTCKRLSIQLLTNGIRPIPVSLDDYFVDRDKTPRDATGDYDFESIHALNIPLLNQQLAALFRGEEVELPRYNFQTGKSEMSGRRLKMEANDVLVVEGIHALNPELTARIPEEQKFRVYASALTTILLDTHNYIPTTDNRLLRRIIRDYKYRGCSARDTIHRWPSVRAGENKWIFPYQENADVMFNSAMIYELAVIKKQAEPLLEQVPENCEEYAEAYRLRKFLRYFLPVDYDKLPPTSLLREFLGGSTFTY
ncbi:MAG: nucleoside kinase [Prevotella sp.]